MAENAFAEASRRFDGAVVPRAIFTDPPIAIVGETEAEVRARHYPAVSKLFAEMRRETPHTTLAAAARRYFAEQERKMWQVQ